MFDSISRRHFLRAGAVSAAATMSPWFGRLASAAAKNPDRSKSCILLWMNGGPSTIDLFDLKPGHANGGPYKEIDTAVPGIKIGEHLPKLAKQMKHLSIIRSMSTKEGDHTRAAYLMRTGALPQGAIDYPAFGALVAKELHSEAADLPPFVSIAPQRFLAQTAYGAGFLGPQFAPLLVADGQNYQQPEGKLNDIGQLLKVQDLDAPQEITRAAADARLDLMRDLESGFHTARPGATTESHKAAYNSAVRLVRSPAAKAFDLTEVKTALREKYGKTLFGQGCLLARRLVERGVPFVEVSLASAQNAPAGWDTHQNNFDQVKALCESLDTSWATLMEDLKDRGLLETTTVIWMGEFGRTPSINPQKGRDHFAGAWSAVLGGGGIKGGQTIGRTSRDGSTVEDRPVNAPDFLATICKAIGIDPEKQNMSNVGRPIRIADKGAKPIKEVVS